MTACPCVTLETGPEGCGLCNETGASPGAECAHPNLQKMQIGPAEGEGLRVVPTVSTDEWAERYCELVNRHPDGIQARTTHDGWHETTFRQLARGEIDAMLQAAPAPASGGWTHDRLRDAVSDEQMRALLSCKDVGSGRAHLARLLNALSLPNGLGEPVAWRWRWNGSADDGWTYREVPMDPNIPADQYTIQPLYALSASASKGGASS